VVGTVDTRVDTVGRIHAALSHTVERDGVLSGDAQLPTAAAGQLSGRAAS
jgi:hypothetical protein